MQFSSLANQRNIKIGIEKSRGSFVLVNKTAALSACFMPGGLQKTLCVVL